MRRFVHMSTACIQWVTSMAAELCRRLGSTTGSAEEVPRDNIREGAAASPCW